ncbi:hypothetical protein H2201_005944 [Coniosporium apollinis]|uniref:Uncharacterized protein n=2 Tax=Coniosporium TaxID=2810619 RepID=A0ABQ9NNE3_9PEZI|nr:hypothetical protein H2199_005234 [Cladosporium sp. JES 115]KAJ9662660.1 hypothetical protein H2201_005944 [Coniosporium apollinis]
MNMNLANDHEDYEPNLEEARKGILINAHVLYGAAVEIFLCGERNQEEEQKVEKELKELKELKDQLDQTDPMDMMPRMALMREINYRAQKNQDALRYPGSKFYAVLARRRQFGYGRPCELEIVLEGPRVDGGPNEAMLHLFDQTMFLMGEKVQCSKGGSGHATTSESQA